MVSECQRQNILAERTDKIGPKRIRKTHLARKMLTSYGTMWDSILRDLESFFFYHLTF